MKTIFYISAIIFLLTFSVFAELPIVEKTISDAFANRRGACIFINCLSGEIIRFNPEGVSERLPPCSTFKIWNTLLGLENQIISSSDELFYKWDGENRKITDWNKDLTLKYAFRLL